MDNQVYATSIYPKLHLQREGLYLRLGRLHTRGKNTPLLYFWFKIRRRNDFYFLSGWFQLERRLRYFFLMSHLLAEMCLWSVESTFRLKTKKPINCSKLLRNEGSAAKILQFCPFGIGEVAGAVLSLPESLQNFRKEKETPLC